MYTLPPGPCAIPPPTNCGERNEPCLALPVPFWAQGFAPVPDTCDLVFTEAVLFL